MAMAMTRTIPYDIPEGVSVFSSQGVFHAEI